MPRLLAACVFVAALVVGVAEVAASTPSAPAARGKTAPPYVARIAKVKPRQIRYALHTGCPTRAADLRSVRLRYWGFDDAPHLGTLIVAKQAAKDVAAAFGILYGARFPIRRIQPVDAYRGSDTRSMAADNTSGFNCRRAVTTGPASWSAHAYGLAIDVNPRENPYRLNGAWLPPAGKHFANRRKVRPGMAVDGGALVQAFARIGWSWGGRWANDPDFQHFSATGN
ncbi:MAG TPA: M15 family metallopeptidase [Gaiellaceae bacterium]|nr:M15 family metallopeptidase [Gaiellaceae bacterium]